MRNTKKLFTLFIATLLILSTFTSYPLTTKADTSPSVDFIVTPSSSELTLNADSLAEGTLNININPEGTIAQNDRDPIDVVFVHDTSGSMKDYFSNAKKSVSAKVALTSAIKYFNVNKKAGDNFYLVPFNSNVRKSGSVKVVEGLSNIENVAKYLDKDEYNTDGTNYTQTLEYAKDLLKNSNNKNKYIIFLTDGEPTVLNYGGYEYVLYTNGTAKYRGSTSSKNYKITQDFIHQIALETSDGLAQNNIMLYSIAFAPQDKIDYQLLQKMSGKTGGAAVLATPENLESIFQSISKKIDSYTISGEVTINLSSFSGNVAVNPAANVTVDSKQVAHIPFKFNFPVGKQPDPSSMTVNLPLIFKKADTYTFNNINLQYDGLSTPKTHPPVTIKVNKDMNSVPGAVLNVKPSADEFIKPPDGNAKGNIDITVTPKGMAPKDERLPIDVVFVHDTSGSMKDPFDGVRKDSTAKNALKSGIDYFESNSKTGDRFYFVPFDSEVSNKTRVNSGCFFGLCWGENINIRPLEGLDLIKNSIGDLDIPGVSNGGTNYNAALNEAKKKFVAGSRSNKYVIFLTDGEPTVLNYQNDKYELLTNNTARKNGKSTPFADAKKLIHEQALNVSSSLGENGITMYSIGFAPEGDVDFELLRNMSLNTGGYAIQGKTGNLSTIFNDISKKVSSSTISGNVSIDLKKFNGDVIVDPTSNFKENDKKVQVPFNITFPVGEKPDPALIQHSLPLQFTKAGIYEFADNVKMSYTDNKGNTQQFTHEPFTVEVKDESAPSFLSEVQIKGNQYYSADNLVKIGETDTERNEFIVEYKLIPDTVFTEITRGSIDQIKITQPLFDGISLANNNQISLLKNGEPVQNGASVKLINEGKAVEINLGSNAITYEKGKFSVEDYTISLKLKADWALPYTMMPQAQMSFFDSRFKAQSQTLNISEQRISMNVHLEGRYNLYTGDYIGTITKINKTDGQILADTQLSNDSEIIQKPVKSMKLINDATAIEVTFYDNTRAILYLRTDYTLKNLSLSQDLQSGNETKGRVGFKIKDLVIGNDVVYEYQIKTKDTETNWSSFAPSALIELPSDLEGPIEIRVRTKGGFSLNSTPVVKTLTIIKESIAVEPNPIELKVGQSMNVNIKIVPEDSTERDFQVTIADSSIAIYENGVVKGIKDGETSLEVTTVDIAGNKIKESIKIKVNPILIKSISVTPNPVRIGKLLEFNSFIIDIQPENATNKELKWTSLNPSIVSILNEGVIYGRMTGTAEIEIRTTDGSDISTTVTVNVGSKLTGIDVGDVLVVEKGSTDENVKRHFRYLPADATNIQGEPQFRSRNESILEVESSGEIIPKRIGETGIEITVRDEDNKTFTAELKVKVVEPGAKDKNTSGDKY
ncbi:VWA domain-containing protein [Robertmurraya andreesenii]|uniref:Uncharacterized protein YjdB/Mg-chelatase subunit ChlD n=1 Tax=Anoxybacillus andreesenii TaxID=1325932 RepID=A0ABT9V5C0_9BACL|nr:VWA domain-containing protein [Robertmurraya andreesenii]MDQ0156134.1 uncharacterized protein YjdB/Mg-chelatase subunit ChlD [Robertmurraya andreesenii]